MTAIASRSLCLEAPTHTHAVWRQRIGVVLATLAVSVGLSALAAQDPVIQGKNEWLFVDYEVPQPELASEVETSLAMIQKTHSLLARQGIALAVVVVPSKIETHQEQLPDRFTIPDYMRGLNDQIQASLRSAGVPVVDLKTVFRDAAVKHPDVPLFYRLDTHWSPSGAYIAAQAVKASIGAHPALSRALDSVLGERYNMNWAAQREKQTAVRDITRLLPAGTSAYGPEEVLKFNVSRATPNKLLGDTSAGGVALVGSSLSGEWTGFADALRYSLQHDLVNYSINADVGPWMVMRGYLRDEAFQGNRPKLILWEMPERALSMGPSYKLRQSQFIVPESTWLAQVSALAEANCEPTDIAVKLEPSGLVATAASRSGSGTVATDYIELSFSKPVDQRSYLAARIVTAGSKLVRLEGSGMGNTKTIQQVDVSGDDTDHAFKTPLTTQNTALNRVKLFPGTTTAFAISDIELCRHPAESLP